MKRPAQSIRWRVILMFFLLVFVAMTVVSVYLVDRIEKYQVSSLKENIDKTVGESNLLTSLGNYEDLSENREEVESYLLNNFGRGFTQEMSVVGEDLTIYASTNPTLPERSAADVFDAGLIASTFVTGGDGESDTRTSEGIPVKNLCYAITNADGEVTGVVFVRADLSEIEEFLARSRSLCVQAILLALVVTIILGVLLSGSITGPIKELTDAAGKISRGDFSADVSVKSGDEIGQLGTMFNTMRDRLDDSLSEISNEKNKLETILTYMADGLVAVDLEGEIMHANPAARHMLGVDQNVSIRNYNYESLLGHLSPQMAFDKLLEGCREGGSELTFDYGAMTFAVRYDRFKDEDGNDIGIIILLQDITERQKLEDMQRDFVANVSHELKTPLTTIKSYTETLLDGAVEDRETAQRFLTIVDSEADRMNRLVKDLLQLSRLDHRQERWHIKESSLIALVDTAVTKVELTAAQKGLQVRRLYEQRGEVRASVDRDRFEQVVMNILSNAIKYTNEGGIDVDVYEEGENAKIVVADTGIGIPEADLPRIFERFYRVDKARSRAMGGTGLGLAITKQIIEEHHGTIEASSTEGKGTRITITLPLANRRGVRNIE